jgi:nicotinamidase-related amidase
VAPSLADLVAPGGCALLLQEVQEGVVGSGSPLAALSAAAASVDLLPRLRELTSAARKAGVPIVHCTAAHMHGAFGANRNARLFGATRRMGTLREAGDDRVRPAAGLLGEGDLVVPRFHGLSPLTGSQLDSLLRNEGIASLIVTGVSLNVAIPNLIFDAVNRSYQVVLVRDAVAGVPIEYGEMMIEYTLRPLTTVATTAELAAAWTATEGTLRGKAEP